MENGMKIIVTNVETGESEEVDVLTVDEGLEAMAKMLVEKGEDE